MIGSLEKEGVVKETSAVVGVGEVALTLVGALEGPLVPALCEPRIGIV